MAVAGPVPERIRRELKPDETVLWRGQPEPIAVLMGRGTRIALDVLMLLGVMAVLIFGRGAVEPPVVLVPAVAGLVLAPCFLRKFERLRAVIKCTSRSPRPA